MSKVKMTHDGQPCRKCGTPVVKRSHDGPSGSDQSYWFSYWFHCSGCKTDYMVDEAKVWITPQTEDATMSDHTIYAATVKQVADLQAERDALLLADGLNRDAYSTLEAENARLRAALEAVEEIEGWCPWCFGTMPIGHKSYCQRQNALGIATT
jgi:hypothetical protein